MKSEDGIPDVIFMICGNAMTSANTKEELEQLAKPYSYKELPNVMNQFDVLVTPSEWEETFGFTVLEALSYGIPVIVSEKVGAKDLILEGKNGFVVASSVETLKFQIADLVRHPSIIDDMNAYIEKNFKVKTMKEHSYELNALYKKLLS